MDAWQIGSALAIIGPAAGFVLGRLTSGVKGQVENNAESIRLIDKLWFRLNKALALNSELLERLEEVEPKAAKYDNSQKLNKERRAARLEREAEEAAKRAETHASLAAIVEQGV